jgi:outer membrane murein-binding lipoprotein Lpp
MRRPSTLALFSLLLGGCTVQQKVDGNTLSVTVCILSACSEPPRLNAEPSKPDVDAAKEP